MSANPPSYITRQFGSAIVIVLAFVVLLTGLVVAFFSRAMSERNVSNSSANETKVELFAQGAQDSIISDLKQEIAAGSGTSSPANGVTIYTPTSPANMVPALTGTSAGSNSFSGTFAPNLIKRSVFGEILASGSTSSAAKISGTSTSLNGRSVSLARWNKALLLPLQTPTSTTDFTPMTSGSTAFAVPDWILVSRNGTNPKTWNTNMTMSGTNPNSVIGRFAYAIYNEGGLLDMNVAGYPPGIVGTPALSGTQTAYKNALAFADLKQIPGIGTAYPGVTSLAGNAALVNSEINNIIGWRNYASGGSTVTLGSIGTAPFNAPSYAWDTTSGSNYWSSVVSNANGFLRTSGTAVVNGQTDKAFSSRQELIQFLTQALPTIGSAIQKPIIQENMQAALQCLGTFSRDINQPSYAPPKGRPFVLATSAGGNNANGLDDQINPSFLAVRVPTTKAGGRNDGTDLAQGEPLMKRRFNLNRLSWVTWEGPSSGASVATQTALLKAGISQAMINAGTAANIQKYFGLNWVGGVWKYNVHNGGNNGTGSIMRFGRPPGVNTQDATTYVQDAGREPDFFELLKASITVGSLGKATVTSNTAVSGGNVPSGYGAAQVPANYRYARDTSIDYQVIQIGANIIDQFDADSYPTRIVFNDGSLPAQEFDGIENLPYLAYFVNGMLRGEAPTVPPKNVGGGTKQWPQADPGPLTGSPGAGIMLQVPALWNPHDLNSSKGSPRPTQFRFVADSADPITAASGNSTGYTKVYVSSVGHDSSGNPAYAYNATSTTLQPANSNYKIDYTTTGRVLDQSNTALTFSDSNGTLFREPTLLLRQGGDIGLQSTAYPSGIKSIDANPVYQANDGVGTSFLGVVLGTFPLRFDIQSGTAPTISAGAGFVGPGGQSQPLVYFTYRVQYADASGNWVTYDTKYGRPSNGRADFNWSLSSSNTGAATIVSAPDQFIPWNWASTVDPRTARFGFVFGALSIFVANELPCSPALSGWISDASGTLNPTKGITFSLRPDNYGGNYFVDFNTNGGSGSLGSTDDPVLDNPFPQHAAGWTSSLVHGFYGNPRYDFSPGMLSQNSTASPFYIMRDATDGGASNNDEFGKMTGNPQPTYYADPDGVVRRAAGAYVPPGVPGSAGTAGAFPSASSPIGLPMAITQASSAVSSAIVTNGSASFNQAQSRPLILNRPFRSVSELGYVFSDTPWKNLDFLTPESGDTALLDVFCTLDTDDTAGLVAGKVDLNTKQGPVLAAIVGGACIDDPKVSDATVGSISSTAPTTIGAALAARTSNSASGFGPLQNVSELVGRWVSPTAIAASTTYIPANATGDLTLTNGYKDGRLSYAGFSGSTTPTSPPQDLNTAYSASTFNGTPSNNASLIKGMTQIERFHEAPIRALASVGETRVWNLMIDLVAQTGRYPATASNLANFNVEGEQHYWVHIAIDRLTGQVIDKQVEVVKE